ncbi:hypothetical protein AB4865_04455 [Capnocytophaga sp. ARDL2]|uniref:hypothetical protein n=1 Tax=Capnocytophaga sp. ARDL2 TaxID=3238809 RepID=UPI003556A7AD
MTKTIKIYAVFFILIMIGLVLFELTKTEVIDWRKNYEVNKKTPFGLYVFNKEADVLLNNQLKRLKISPYDYYENKPNLPAHNILVINQSIDDISWKKIENQVENGSDLLLFFDQKLPHFIEETISLYNSYEHFITLKFTDKKLNKITSILDKRPSAAYLNQSKKEVEILGYFEFEGYDNDIVKKVNFIKIKKGKGNIFVHTEPLVLTNYHLLKNEDKKYAEAVFSYLPNRETVWFVEDTSVVVSQSPMRVILAHPPLKYAWWLFLFGLLLFAIFTAKRKQRIVPVIEPLRNKSVEFVRSVGNLYLQEGDFHDMMAKKAQYFLYKIRTELLIDTHILDENFIKKLHLKTGKPIERIQEAVEYINKAQNPNAQVQKKDLVRMNEVVDEIM